MTSGDKVYGMIQVELAVTNYQVRFHCAWLSYNLACYVPVNYILPPTIYQPRQVFINSDHHFMVVELLFICRDYMSP